MTKILFVCMGNICRSPLAEAVFRHKAGERQVADRFEIDSAGTSGYHAGEPADPRMRETAATHGIDVTSRARGVETNDFGHFDLLICMDENNREDLLNRGAPEAKLRLLLECDPEAPIVEVPDPYYGGPEGFRTVYMLVNQACAALLDQLVEPASSS